MDNFRIANCNAANFNMYNDHLYDSRITSDRADNPASTSDHGIPVTEISWSRHRSRPPLPVREEPGARRRRDRKLAPARDILTTLSDFVPSRRGTLA